jgi:hypothetical protein
MPAQHTHSTAGTRCKCCERKERARDPSSAVQSRYQKADRDASMAGSDDFTWSDASILFVALFSHAEVLVRVKDGGVNLGPSKPSCTASVKVADLIQGKAEYTLELKQRGRDVCAALTRLDAASVDVSAASSDAEYAWSRQRSKTAWCSARVCCSCAWLSSSTGRNHCFHHIISRTSAV